MNLKQITNKFLYNLIRVIFYTSLLASLMATVIFLTNLYADREIIEDEYQDINELKISAKRSLDFLNEDIKIKTVPFEIHFGSRYFYYPLMHKVYVNEIQLKEFLTLIKTSMEDNKINQKELENIGTYLRELVDIENSKNIESIKENLAN